MRMLIRNFMILYWLLLLPENGRTSILMLLTQAGWPLKWVDQVHPIVWTKPQKHRFGSLQATIRKLWFQENIFIINKDEKLILQHQMNKFKINFYRSVKNYPE